MSKQIKRYSILLAAMVAAAFLVPRIEKEISNAQAQIPQTPSFTLSGDSVEQGDMLVATLLPYARVPRATLNVSTKDGRYYSKNYTPDENGRVYIGIDVRLKPDDYKVCMSDGTIVWYCAWFKVRAREFTETRMPGNRMIGNLSFSRARTEEAAKREAFDRAETNRAYALAGPYLEPLFVNYVTGEFGAKRKYSDGFIATHLGTDLRADIGTEVLAINSGKVLMVARDFYFEGNMVIIDHGSGILSVYMHLSDILVKEGEMVDSAQKIGLSGDTGQGVTAPHLHLSVKVNGVYVDPMGFIETINSR